MTRRTDPVHGRRPSGGRKRFMAAVTACCLLLLSTESPDALWMSSRVVGGETAVPQTGGDGLEALYRQAQAARTTGDLSRLLQACRGAQQDADSQQQQYLQQLAAWVLNRRGEALADQAMRAEAQSDAAGAARLRSLAASDFTLAAELSDDWRPWHNRGLLKALAGQTEEALRDFAAALDRDPDRVDTRFNLAELQLQLGHYAEAAEAYSAVLRQRPGDSAARRGRAHARFYLGQYGAALEDFNRSVQDNPEDASAWADRADLQAYLGRWQQAAADYRQAIRLDPQLGRALQSAAWLMATCPDATIRDAQLGIRAAQRAIELDGADDYRYLDTLAAAWANAGDFDRAIETIDAAMAKAPPELLVQLRQRRALYERGTPFRDSVE